MLTPGADGIAIEGTGGLGLSVILPDRPDIVGSGPGFVTVTGGSGAVPPPPPIWGTVTSGAGLITIGGDSPAIPITCPEVVDGYEVYAGPSAMPPPAGAPTIWTASGSLVISINTPVYLYARSARGILRSSWVPYLGINGTVGEWVLVYDDSPFPDLDDAPYPDCTELTAGYDYTRFFEGESQWRAVATNTPIDDGPMLGILTAAGVRHSVLGGRTEFCWRTTLFEPGHGIGAIFGAKAEAIAGFLTESFYVLFLDIVHEAEDYTGLNLDIRAILGKFVNGAYTEIARSGNLFPSFFWDVTTRLGSIAFVRRDNTFSLEGGLNNDDPPNWGLAWEHTDTTIPPDDERIYTGFYTFSADNFCHDYMTDWIRVYSRTGNGGLVLDPGTSLDAIRERTATENFPLSHFVRHATGNSEDDHVHVRLDDDRMPEMLGYTWEGTRKPEADMPLAPRDHTHEGDLTAHALDGELHTFVKGDHLEGEVLQIHGTLEVDRVLLIAKLHHDKLYFDPTFDNHHEPVHSLNGSAESGVHTVSGLTEGDVCQAFSATTFGWGRLSHSFLGDVGADDHHNQAHLFIGSDHDITGANRGDIPIVGEGGVLEWIASEDLPGGAGGDFMADGTVPMAGNLDFADNEAIDMIIQSVANEADVLAYVNPRVGKLLFSIDNETLYICTAV